MFDTTEEFTFDIKAGGAVLWQGDGIVHMDDDDGYGFIVTHIELETDDPDRPVVHLSEKSADPNDVKLFRELAEQARESEYLQERFSEALAEYELEVA